MLFDVARFKGVLFLNVENMAEGKKKVIVYIDWIDQFKDLTDEEAGKLIKHFFAYVNDLNPVSDRLTELLFNPIKATLKRDLEAWEKKQGINRENGKKGGRPKNTEKTSESENNPNNPVGYFKTHDNPKKGVSDSDSDSVINNYTPSIDEFVAYAISLKPNVNVENVKLKYNAWLVDGWNVNRGGKKYEIKNWKNTLSNTIQYLGEVAPQQIDPLVAHVEAQIAKLKGL